MEKIRTIEGGLEDASKWRITIDVVTANPSESVKAIIEAVDSIGVRHDMIDFHRV